MEDLSRLLPGDPVTALAPTSQAGGNMMSSNRQAMTAPGSDPTDPLPPAKDQGDPKIGSIKLPKGPPGPWQTRPKDDGAPDSGEHYSPPPPAWKKTN